MVLGRLCTAAVTYTPHKSQLSCQSWIRHSSAEDSSTANKTASQGLKSVREMATNSFNPINTTAAPDGNGSENSGSNGGLNIMSLIIYSLAFVLGVLGNGVVIWVTGFKMKKTVNTVWYLNLAVADFLFTAFLPLSVTYTALDFHWHFGNFMCKLNTTISFLNMFASVYILVVISVDRCVSVVWPVCAQNHRNVRKASYVSLCVWVVALILSAPYFIFRDTEKDSDKIFCFDNYALSDDYETPSVTQLWQFRYQAMIITRFLLGFVVPFTVIVSCYAVIIHRLRRNRTLANQSSRPFKIIAAIIITFFLCWAPFHIMSLIEMASHMPEYSSKILKGIIPIGMPIATSLAFLNSCLNPLLYVFMGQDFKHKVRKSILNVLESAFQEEETRSHTYTKSVDTSQSQEFRFEY
ncbi:chemokine-like receptor 1 [Oreochromis niloticus]|uniref:chemokine-like receptor 1 n=1 Tax=Oreochromis niloticus TaxID=8128 RepID=UPI000DF1B021|nr:chemokine-like receptor 1 [Oreochromis niloticus]